jgi:hypothetical protein
MRSPARADIADFDQRFGHPGLVFAAAALAALACRPLSAAEPAKPVPPPFSVGHDCAP